MNLHYINCVIEKLDESVYHIKNKNIDLKLTSVKNPLMIGGKGYLDFTSKTTYYYSLTNLKTTGRIKIRNKWIDVSGKSWMDHQWADVCYSNAKWNWFSIQLDNETEIVFCMYDDNDTRTYFADISNIEGSQEHHTEIIITPRGKCWKSPKSKASYPLSWNLKIPAKKINLNVTAILDNQEMLFGSINYWEGAIRINGMIKGKKVTGTGFMELVGYFSNYNNINYIFDEVEDKIIWFISLAKNGATNLTGNIKKIFST